MDARKGSQISEIVKEKRWEIMALSEDEEFELLSLEREKAMAQQDISPPQNLSKTPNLLQQILSLDPNASTGTQAAQIASAPFRGFRGLAVGLNKALPSFRSGEDQGLGQVAPRMVEAVKPGFKPEGISETIASVLGESAPLMPLGGAMSAGLEGAALASGVGAGTSALMQKSERGSVSPIEAGASGAIAGLIPLSAQFIKGLYPKIAAQFTKTEPEAFQRLMDDPQFLQKFSGSVESIRGRANEVVKGFQSVKDRLGTAFENFKTFYSMRPDANEVVSELSKTSGNARSISEIVKDLKAVKMASSPVVERKVVSPLLGASGNPIETTVKEPGLFARERLMKLIKLNQDLNQATEGSFNDYTYKLKSMIKDEIKKIPQGRHYMKLSERWSDFKEIEENLGRDLADPDKAPIVLEKMMRGDIKGVLRGSYGKVQSAVKELESLGGVKPIMRPLRDEILAGMLRGSVSQLTPKGVIGKAIMLSHPGIGSAEMLLSSPRFMAKMTAPIRALGQNAGKASTVIPSAIQALMNNRNQ